MNIFITGSNGFVGTHLREYLIADTDIKLFTPSSKELDLSDEDAVDHYILQNKIDIIVHAANRGGGRDTLDMKSITENVVAQAVGTAPSIGGSCNVKA